VSELVWHKAVLPEDEAAAPPDQEWIEIAFGPDGTVYIRETGHPEIVAKTTAEKWDAFVKGVKAGEFDHFAGL
jgi:hypothetical protein